MKPTLDEVFDTSIKQKVENAKGIAYDNCHKIYVLMDNEQMVLMEGYGYDPLLSKDELSSSEMLWLLRKWYEGSCGLRFIQAVTTNPENPNAGFEHLIDQFAYDEEGNPFPDEEDTDAEVYG